MDKLVVIKILTSQNNNHSNNQFKLLSKQRFGPFFLTQFFGAFNDNVFKNALLILIAYQSTALNVENVNTVINFAAILFITPFFLFSATAGQIADGFDKSKLIRRIKIAEIAIMLFAAIGFFYQHIPLLLIALFFMGTQSSLFGPIKYSIIPQHLHKDELVGGNALVETGTFIAILLGTMLGGILISVSLQFKMLVPYTIIAIAILGYLSSLKIPIAPATDPHLKINWNPLIETFENIRILKKSKILFNSVLGISWFWFLGATYLTQLPNFTRTTLGANEQVVTFFLALFCLGIGIGSLLCERLSNRTIELGLVPIGSIGLTLFGIDVYFSSNEYSPDVIIGLHQFVSNTSNWKLISDFFLLGVFGGIYIVPLYALIQTRSNPKRRSRVIAGVNILNAFFILVAGLYALFLLNAGLSIPQLFLVAAILNAVVAIYIYTLIPEFFMRFVVWILVHLVYRVKKINLDKIPEKGPVILVSNHVSLMDALIIGGCVRRPIRFVMYHKIFNIPFLRFIFKTANAIPIAPKKEDPELLKLAYNKIEDELNSDNIIGIFPEGKLTPDGEIGEFKPGIENIHLQAPVTIVPMALNGLWGSFFSNQNGKPMRRLPRKLWRKIKVIAGEPILNREISANQLRLVVENLLENI